MMFQYMIYYLNAVVCVVVLFVPTMSNEILFEHKLLSKTPKHSIFTEGEFAYLECLSMNSNIQISWEKNNRRLEESKHVIIMKSGSIFFHNVKYEESGRYSCVAEDSITGAIQKASAALQIKRRERVEDVCGIPISREIFTTTLSPRLVSGLDTVKGAHPWQVAFFRNDERFCDGALLNDRWIATSAVCFAGISKTKLNNRIENYTIKLGKYTLWEDEDEEFVTHIRHHSSIIVHPYHPYRDFINSIALVRLSDPVRFTNYILPICLGDRELGEKLLTPDAKNHSVKLGVVTGWGISSLTLNESNVLQERRIPVISQKQCELLVDIQNEESLFCAGYGIRGTQDGFFGDTGSPFAMQHNDRWYLMGLGSGGLGLTEEYLIGFYTRVPNFSEWIKTIIKS